MKDIFVLFQFVRYNRDFGNFLKLITHSVSKDTTTNTVLKEKWNITTPQYKSTVKTHNIESTPSVTSLQGCSLSTSHFS